ncbi:hypothetical protein FS837_009593 [Tulasnella sp. UAMH 9824]|nr:hypothetical protein FS837_009593 [Tulasnella sp. UAMH 9824]
MEIRRLMQDACAGEEPDEAAVIALYSSAASEFALDDFVAATKEILNLEAPKNPLESVVMEILGDVLERASNEDDGAEELFSLLMNNGRPKEIIIALDEALGNLSHKTTSDSLQDEEDNDATKLCLLVHGYSLVLPRMVPRRVKAEETVDSTLTAIRTAANVFFVRSAEPQEAEAYISSTIQLLSNAMGCFEAFEQFYPRQATPISRRLDLSGVESARQVLQKALLLSDSFGDSIQRRLTSVESASQEDAVPSFILLAHDSRHILSPESLEKTMAATLTCLISGLLADEALAWVLRFLHSGSRTIAEDVACSLSSALVQVASLSSDPVIRQVAFQCLTDLLLRTSPALSRQLLEELVVECPFPQMRTAAVSLLRTLLLAALESEESSPLASPDCLPLMSAILKHDPPDALQQPFSVMSEARGSVRLVDALGLYYIVLIRDSENRTGVRGPAYGDMVKEAFIDPLKSALARWEAEQNGESNELALELFSIRNALERVDSALAKLRPQSSE